MAWRAETLTLRLRLTLAEVLHEGLERVHRSDPGGGVAEGHAMLVDIGRENRKQIGVLRAAHLGRVMLPYPPQAGLIIGERIGHGGAQQLDALSLAQRQGIAP